MKPPTVTHEPRDGGACTLVLNAGSSSLKFAVFAGDGSSWLARGKVGHLGGDATLAVHAVAPYRSASRFLGRVDALQALHAVLAWQAEAMGGAVPYAVGHRLVHSGPHLLGPVLVSDEVIARLRAMERYDPAHQSIELGFIAAVAQRWPRVPQVACFDTSFHRTLPERAYRLPVSRQDTARGLRRYGFHGLSYTHALEELRRVEPDRGRGRVVIAHLGGGASLAAVRDGACIDTTMGFTPTGGVPMSSRSGDVDPGVFLWLARNHGLSVEQIFEQLTERSGLFALAETSQDLRDLLQREGADPGAAQAVDVFVYAVRKAVGSLAAALGGIDVLAFTGGVGEHLAPIRERVCRGLEFLGLELDLTRNAENASVISAAHSRVRVRVIAADEESVIAREVSAIMERQQRT